MIYHGRPRWYRVDLPVEARKADDSLITTVLHGEPHNGGTQSLTDQVALEERILGHPVPRHELDLDWAGHLTDGDGYGKCE
eukprot:704228-Prymnesium_polylepis.1